MRTKSTRPIAALISFVALAECSSKGGAFISEHGSWDRSALNGYQVIFVPFVNGRPVGKPTPVVTGFLGKDNETVHGRPVGLALDRSGALLVADDVGNTVWRVTATQPET
jgi:glucose/arabinose dehydrogenase